MSNRLTVRHIDDELALVPIVPFVLYVFQDPAPCHLQSAIGNTTLDVPAASADILCRVPEFYKHKICFRSDSMSDSACHARYRCSMAVIISNVFGRPQGLVQLSCKRFGIRNNIMFNSTGTPIVIKLSMVQVESTIENVNRLAQSKGGVKQIVGQ